MKIRISEGFRNNLKKQVEYIAEDKPGAARKFKNELLKEIKDIAKMPMSYRKSIYFDREEIRDMIFKGYVITFRINKDQNSLEVFGLTKYKADIHA